MGYIKLGNICSIKTGKLDANASSQNGEYPFFTCAKESLSIDTYSYDCECVLVAGNGDLNVKYYNGKFDAYQRTYIIEVNEKSKFNTKFIYLLLNGKIDELRNNSIGGVIKYIKLGNLADINVPNISMNEQNKIIEKFFKMSGIINIKKSQVSKIHELIKSQFIEMFGDVTINDKKWQSIKLDAISIIKSGGTPTRNHPEYFKGNIPWITTVALGKNIIDKNDAIEFITEEAVANSATKVIPGNSLLFGIRVGVGKISMNSVPMCTNQDIVAITNIDSRFRILFLKKVIEAYSEYFNKQKRGATIQGITSETLKEIQIPIVEYEKQDKFIKILQQIDKQKFEFEKSLKKLEEMQTSLMEEYFG
jgi:type I restriction enzyme S subunit